MIYSVTPWKSCKNGKWMYFLDRDGKTCFVSNACHRSSGSAIAAARRKTTELIARNPLSGLAGPIKVQVSK